MINDLPTVFEVVTGAAKKQQKEKSSVSNHSSTKSKSNSKLVGTNFLDNRLFCFLACSHYLHNMVNGSTSQYCQLRGDNTVLFL